MSTSDPLIPLEDLERSRPEVLRRIPGLKQDFMIDVNGDDEWARSLAYWMLFEHWPELAGVELDARRRFYNRFFWATRFFAFRDFARKLPNTDREHLIFKMIERAAEDPDVDWQLVEELDTRAKQVPGSGTD